MWRSVVFAGILPSPIAWEIVIYQQPTPTPLAAWTYIRDIRKGNWVANSEERETPAMPEIAFRNMLSRAGRAATGF